MTGHDLLSRLLEFSPDILELPVRIFADHGQAAMMASDVNEATIEEEAYMAELVDPDEADDSQPKCILIEAA